MKKSILISSMIITLGGLLSWNIYVKTHVNKEANVNQQISEMKQERRILYWYDPMKPDQHFDKPGKSPFMDMELVPKYEDEHSLNDNQQKSVRFKQAFNVRLGHIQADDQQKYWVSNDAVLLAGKRAFVFVSEDGGYFNPVEVQLGETKNAMTQIMGEVKAQQPIALSAQFLIDAESNVASELDYIKGQKLSHD